MEPLRIYCSRAASEMTPRDAGKLHLRSRLPAETPSSTCTAHTDWVFHGQVSQHPYRPFHIHIPLANSIAQWSQRVTFFRADCQLWQGSAPDVLQ